ncbi:MAG: MBL fold metallo-hydrolase [Thermodesulfobacteriota bacterium]
MDIDHFGRRMTPGLPEDQGTEFFPRPLAEGLWVLGNHYFNLYLAAGSQASALIEVGVSATADAVINQLDSLGIRPSFLVVTHPHADHVTGLQALTERYPDALVVAGQGAPEFLANPRSEEAILKEDRHIWQALKDRGIEPGRPPISQPPSLMNCLIAQDGDEMDLGGMTLRFLEVHGHSPAGITVYIPEVEALVASDSLGFRFEKRGFLPLFLGDYAAYVRTNRRLSSLPTRVLGIAHQGPLIGREVAAAAFEQAQQAAHALRDRILKSPHDADAVADELFEEWYAEEFLLYSRENIQRVCEAVVKRGRQT